MSKIPRASDLLNSGGLPGSIDRMLASPEYGEAFASLCMDASRLVLLYMDSGLSGKAWRSRYTAGAKSVLSDTACKLDGLKRWFEEIATKCPGTRDRLMCRELLARLTGSDSCD